jgi:3-hydroxybutyrate dehydrogenase
MPAQTAPRTAIVTGSTSGIGKATAEALARAGFNVMLNGFGDPAAIEGQRAALAAATGVGVAYHGADLTQVNEIEALIAETVAAFGSVDVVVNNAGMQFVAPVEDFPVDRWDKIIALNLSAAFHTTRLTFGQMKARGWGRIINIASAHALVASPFKSAYVAAKHGIAGLTKAVALEGATSGVRCNAICPGYVFTPLVENQIADTARARGISEEDVKRNVLLAAQPTKEFVTVDQVAGMVVFLTSPHADSINGAVLAMDGGWTAT